MKHLLLMLLILIVASCSKLEDGYVEDKIYEPFREYTTTHFNKVGDVRIPYTIHHTDYEDFVVIIKNADDEDKIYVSEEEYNRVSLGDYFVVDESKHSYKDNNNSRKRRKKRRK